MKHCGVDLDNHYNLCVRKGDQMSNKLKRKAKKKTFDFGEYTISLPSGTMLESFIKYTAEEPWNIDRVTDFLDAHSARVRK